MEINRIVGEPKHESSGTVDITYSNKNVTVTYPTNDDLSQFGTTLVPANVILPLVCNN